MKIYITKLAQNHFLKLLSKHSNTQIRISVTNPGTENAKCNISYCPEYSVTKSDIKLKFKSFLVYINKYDSWYLKNAKIDLIKEKLQSQLTIYAPNARSKKIKDKFSLFENIKNVLHNQINPILENHGGRVQLIKITKDMFVVISFLGGCNGCSMSNYTLKEGIEKKLIFYFPEIKGVIDDTDHKHGRHSYT